METKNAEKEKERNECQEEKETRKRILRRKMLKKLKNA